MVLMLVDVSLPLHLQLLQHSAFSIQHSAFSIQHHSASQEDGLNHHHQFFMQEMLILVDFLEL